METHAVTVAQQDPVRTADPSMGGLSTDAVWVLVAMGFGVAFAILWVVDALGRRS